MPPRAQARFIYGINAIDNDVAPWRATRDAFTGFGVMLVVEPSGRRLPRFQSKLLGQLRLFEQIQLYARTDYVRRARPRLRRGGV